MPRTQPEGFLAPPSGTAAGGVLVLHAWWGLNDTMKGVCSRLAEAGFVAFAPDLHHGKIATTIPEAERLLKSLESDSGERARAEVAEAAAYLRAQVDGHLAVIGFSMGAYYALDLSASDPENVGRAVIFYGTGPADFTRSRAEYLGHFAENDPYETSAGVDALEKEIRDAGRPVTFHRYPSTGHWFFEPDRPDAYDEAAAALAWERTLAFLKR